VKVRIFAGITAAAGVVLALTAVATRTTAQPTPSPTPRVVCAGLPNICPAQVSYDQGWNLIAVTPGTDLVGTSGPLFTLQAGDTAYELVLGSRALHTGQGYWAYFDRNTPVSLPQSGEQSLALTLPAGQFVMIGNPFGLTATVHGADAVDIYTTYDGRYQETTELRPGQGAWAFSNNGGAITITLWSQYGDRLRQGPSLRSRGESKDQLGRSKGNARLVAKGTFSMAYERSEREAPLYFCTSRSRPLRMCAR
jgi:hypothetical protein